jgi:ABC-2 type transport system ATP-binding protein
MDILVASHIHKRYGNHIALKDVSLHVPRQSIFGLLGPNGAGKTSLIRIINQIIAADEGSLVFNGETLGQKHIGHIGYLPEERGLYKKMKVGEQLLYLARLRGLSRSEAVKRIKMWFNKFDIVSWSGKNVEDLSKGMQQKVQFIATVLHEPELLILDEPFSGFDPINANLIKDEILELREKGTTIIFSTHRMESVEELCDYIALIHKSSKILDGSKSEIKRTYQSNTFIIEHLGALIDAPEYDIIESVVLADNYYRTVLQAKGMANPNLLLQLLLPKTEIHAFKEKIPDMNEIFLAKVKEEQYG